MKTKNKSIIQKPTQKEKKSSQLRLLSKCVHVSMNVCVCVCVCVCMCVV